MKTTEKTEKAERFVFETVRKLTSDSEIFGFIIFKTNLTLDRFRLTFYFGTALREVGEDV